MADPGGHVGVVAVGDLDGDAQLLPVQQSQPHVGGFEVAGDQVPYSPAHIGQARGVGQVFRGTQHQLRAVKRQTCLSRILLGGGLRSRSRVQGVRGPPRCDAQPQLRAACRSQVRQPGQFPGRPGTGLGVNRAQGPQRMALAVGQRHAGVSDHLRVTDGRGTARLLVLASIGQYQRAAGGRHALTQQARQRGLAAGRPRLSQSNLARKHLLVRLHQRHQRYRYPQRVGHQPREPLHPRIRGRRQPHLTERFQPRGRPQPLLALLGGSRAFRALRATAHPAPLQRNRPVSALTEAPRETRSTSPAGWCDHTGHR